MAKRRRETPDPGPPQIPPEQGIQLLQAQIEKAQQLLSSRPLSDDDHSAWELVARNCLEKAFGTNSPNVSSVIDVGSYGAFPMNAGEEWWEEHRAESLQTQISRLEGLVEVLATETQLSGGTTAQVPGPRGHKVFLVHGHDEGALQQTARFLEQLGQDVVILREQPNEGRTIIEKFEDYSDVGFAVVLLTPDDLGRVASSSPEDDRHRARQNVVFELGYFIGRLGRKRVCALYVEDVELPSDYSGVLFVQLDGEGAWKMALAREMKAAGFPVDMNRAI